MWTDTSKLKSDPCFPGILDHVACQKMLPGRAGALELQRALTFEVYIIDYLAVCFFDRHLLAVLKRPQ